MSGFPTAAPAPLQAVAPSHGWPESWYAWRMLIRALARDFRVIAVDQRGMGLSDKPVDGYDPHARRTSSP